MIGGAKEQLEYSKDQSESVFGEMFIFIFLAAVFIAFILLAYVVMKLFQKYPIAEKIKEHLVDTKKKMFFNNIIRSFSVSFIKLAIAAGLQIMMLTGGSQYLKESEKI